MVAENVNAAELRSALEDFVRNSLDDGSPVGAETPLADLGLDSFVLLEMVLFVERRFGIKTPLELLTPGNTRTIAALSECCAGVARSTTQAL
ncbi:MAG: acyl carrier protein [Bdellovibrionota bacterium]